MASAYINLYQGNPTAGGTDGTVVSTGNDFSSPINFDLDAEQNETKIVPLALRTETGYKVTDCTVTDYNDTNNKITFCLTQDGTYSESITIPEITDTNVVFYVKAISSDDEPAQTDKNIKIRYYGSLQRVS